MERLAGALVAIARLPEIAVPGATSTMARLRLKLAEVDPVLVGRARAPIAMLLLELVEAAKAAARVCALNALAAVDALVGIDTVTRVVKVVGFVASAPGFNGQPGVVNGASEFLGEVFGDAGAHARSAVGVSELPLNAPVEVELIVEVA